MPLASVAVVARVGMFDDEVKELGTAKVVCQRPSLCLIDPHQWGVEDKSRLHPKIERRLQVLNRVITAIRVTRVVRFTHSANQVLQAATIGDTSCEGEEQDIATRYKRTRQIVFKHLDLNIARQRGIADLTQNTKVDLMVLAQLLLPIRKTCNFLPHLVRALKFNDMPLAIIKANGFDQIELI